MAFKIYTKTGDKGETSLFGGKRLPKSHLRIDSYGTIDELNSFVGLLRDELSQEPIRALLAEIQNRLFTIGSNLAGDPEKDMPTPDLKERDILALEQAIDDIEQELPPLKNFILPGGHRAVSVCHISRCVCRRAERLVVALSHESSVETLILKYLNRLSDYFFVLARKLSKDLGAEEVIWRPRSQ